MNTFEKLPARFRTHELLRLVELHAKQGAHDPQFAKDQCALIVELFAEYRAAALQDMQQTAEKAGLYEVG